MSTIPLLLCNGLSADLKLAKFSWTVLRVDWLLLEGDLDLVCLFTLTSSSPWVSLPIIECSVTTKAGTLGSSWPIFNLSRDITVFMLPAELAVTDFFESFKLATCIFWLAILSCVFMWSSDKGCLRFIGLLGLPSWSMSVTLTLDCLPVNKIRLLQNSLK